MIIDAAPRLRDGPLEDYSISLSHSLHQTIHSQSDNLQQKGSSDLLLTNCGDEKTDLLVSHKNIGKNRRTQISHRRHPYGRDRRYRDSYKWELLLSTLKKHKYFSTLHDKNTTKSRLESVAFTPFFTANANENNDNCPNSTYCSDEFALTRNKFSESTPVDTICDVEIEDLTTAPKNDHSSEDLHTWRQRRKSFNTNPLSSVATRVFLDDNSQSKNSEKSISCESKALLEDDTIKKNTINYFGHSKDRATLERREQETSSIERLVEFFEANSTTAPYNRNSHGHTTESNRGTHIYGGRNSLNCDRSTAFISRYASHQTEQTQRPLSVGTIPHCGRNNTVDFVQLLQNNWSSVIKTSSQYLHTNTNTSHNIPETGGIYNNNANAASAPPETKFFWAGNPKTENFPSTSDRYQNPRNTSSSPVYFPADCRRCASSLARVSPDVELIDLESTRFSSWPKTQLTSSSFERQQNTNSFRFDNLIDLQSTSRRHSSQSTDWGRIQDSNFIQKNNRNKTPGNSGFNHTSAKTDRSQERFQNSYCRETQESRSHRASENHNHHNSPWTFSEVERSIQNRIQEKQFSFDNLSFHHALLLRKRSNFFQSDSNDMGCIQSIAKSKVSPDRCHHGVIVEDIQAAIDRTPTEIEEKSSIVLRYRTPYFRASAHVIVPPIPRKETWTVGWIQACDSMKFINQYGNLGNSSWEIPALKDRRITAVSDSDGVSYPWYGNTTEIATVEGPTDTSRSLTLRMNDNFYPSVTWDIPVSEGSEAHLTHIARDQTFTTWLAAVNQTTGRLEVLRTVKWHFYLEIEVDPTQELGKRARIVSPLVQKQPIVLKNNTEPVYISSPHRSSSNASTTSGRQKRMSRRPWPGGDNNSNNHTNFIPKSALVRPSANNAQTLIWRPTRDVPVIVVPAKEEYKENNEVVWFSRQPTIHGHDHNVRVLSSQEMTQLKKSIS